MTEPKSHQPPEPQDSEPGNLPETPSSEMPEFDFSEVKPAQQQGDDFGFTPLPTPERRRRPRRPLVVRPTLSEIEERLENIASKAVPTFDFFIFSLVSAAILGFGYLLDSPAVLFFGILTTPVLYPWLGAALGIATAERRYLLQTLGGFTTSILIVFAIGLLSGLSSHLKALVLPPAFNQLYLHSDLQVPNLLLLIFGAIVFALSFIQGDEKPLLPSLMLAYALYLPVSAAGFGLGAGVGMDIFQRALFAFFVHLSVSLLLSLVVFYYMGFRPFNSVGYSWGIGAIVVCVLIVVSLAGLEPFLKWQASVPTPQATPTVLLTTRSVPTDAQTVPDKTITPSPSLTPKAARTLAVTTNTPTPTRATPTLLPTPVYGRVEARGENGGAVIRESPDGQPITTIQNGFLVELMPDVPVLVGNQFWVHVRVNLPDDRVIDGWVLQALIVTPTPQP